MSSGIYFFNEDITYRIPRKIQLKKWITDTLQSENRIPGVINIILCNDEYLLDLNVKYLNHNTLTDIITFPLEDESGLVSGDIFISLPRVQENAAIFHQPVYFELQRVMIHGILHLVGYRDKTKRMREEMRVKEDFYLKRFPD